MGRQKSIRNSRAVFYAGAHALLVSHWYVDSTFGKGRQGSGRR